MGCSGWDEVRWCGMGCLCVTPDFIRKTQIYIRDPLAITNRRRRSNQYHQPTQEIKPVSTDPAAASGALSSSPTDAGDQTSIDRPGGSLRSQPTHAPTPPSLPLTHTPPTPSWLICWLIGWLIGWLICWLIGFNAWLADLTAWLTCWLIGFTAWLADLTA